MLAKCIILKPSHTRSFRQLSRRHNFAEKALFITVLISQSLTIISFKVLKVILAIKLADQLQVYLLQLRVDKSHNFYDLFSLLVDQWVRDIIDNVSNSGRWNLKMVGPKCHIVLLRVFVVEIKNLVDFVSQYSFLCGQSFPHDLINAPPFING